MRVYVVVCVCVCVVQVKVSLDGLTESLTSLSDIGDCVARVEFLLKNLKTIEENAQVHTHTHTLR